MAQDTGSLDILKNDSNLSSNSNNSSWGGVRPGAGRPIGKQSASTMERAAIKKAFEDRVAYNADRLFDVQFNLARGEQYLMHKFTIGHGKNRRTEVEVVTDPEIIKQYINDELENDDDEFYFISTKPSNGMAIDSMLDRAFGKASQKIDNSGEQKLIIITRRVSQDSATNDANDD